MQQFEKNSLAVGKFSYESLKKQSKMGRNASTRKSRLFGGAVEKKETFEKFDEKIGLQI